MWLINLMFGWFGLSTLIGIVALVVSIVLPAPLMQFIPGLRDVARAVAIYAFGFSFVYGLGFNQARQSCQEAALRSQIETLRRDHAALIAQAARNEKNASQLKSAEDKNRQQVEQIHVVLKQRPQTERCVLSSDDARRLRAIK